MQAKTLLPLSKLNFEQLVESTTENPLIFNDPSEKQPKKRQKRNKHVHRSGVTTPSTYYKHLQAKLALLNEFPSRKQVVPKL